MRVFRSLEEARDGLNPESGDVVCTLGVFDGVHTGHRHVLRQCMRLAAERSGQSVVVTFHTHPRAIISGRAPKLITSIDHRLRLFEDLGIANALVLSFDDGLRQMTASEFSQRVFVETLGASVVVLGHNCFFGQDREGSADWLMERAKSFPFEVRKAQEVRLGPGSLSSSTIRQAILAGDLDAAATMLGRPYSIYGTVVHGDERGRTIGFPTANVDLHHELRPPQGVYGAMVQAAGNEYLALVNIGVRPTFREQVDVLNWESRDRFETVEAHLLGFDGDLYGQDVEITFLSYLREERTFESVEALISQIGSDRDDFLASLPEHVRETKLH